MGRGHQRRAALRKQRRPWWKGPLPFIATTVIVCVAIITFIVIGNEMSTRANAAIGQPVSASLVKQLTDISPSIIDAVGAGTLVNGKPLPFPLRVVTSTPLSANGKPQILYIGASSAHIAGR